MKKFNNQIILTKKDNLILTQKWLTYILENASQISATDFTGWILKKPILFDNSYIYSLGLSFNGDIYITAISKESISHKKLKPFTIEIWGYIINVLQECKILENAIDNPFLDLEPQFNLNMDSEITNFIETPLFNKGEDYFKPMIKTIKIKKESIITCPKCKKSIAFDIDDAQKNMYKYNVNYIDLLCSWCKEKIEIDDEYIKNCKIIYKECKK